MFEHDAAVTVKYQTPFISACCLSLLTVISTISALGYSGTAFSADVGLEWDPVVDDRVAFYEVHWGTESGKYQWTQSSTATSTTLANLNFGETYYIAAKACAEGGEPCSSYSDEITTTPVDGKPTAAFSISSTSGTAPLTTRFTNTSTGTIDTFLWSFGDGSTSSDPSPSHVYTVPGTYAVTLSVSGTGGTSSTTQAGAVVVSYAAPVADFEQSATTGLAPLAITFTNSSGGEVDSYRWDFGDGGSSTAPTAVHTYKTRGAYTVSLEVQGPGGNATKTKSNLVTVTAPPPVANFTGCTTGNEAPFTVAFGNQSSGNITGYLWDFGDGSTSKEMAPSHTYALPGYYEISLSVTGPDGKDILSRADCVYVSAPQPAIEVGEVKLNQQRQRVNFKQPFADPIVVAKSLSANDSAPAMARIDQVDATGFSVRVQEWDYLDDRHGTETLGYIVMERGLHQLRDGTMIEADEFQFTSDENNSEHYFASAFTQEPVVITAVTTVNEPDAVTTRIGNIDTFGFSLSLQEQKSSKQRHTAETVSFIAWEPSSGTIGGRQFEVGRLFDDLSDLVLEVTDQPSVARFSSGFSLPPVFASDMQSMNDSDPANLRWSNKEANSVEVWVEEDQSRPSKLRYSGETVGYIAVGNEITEQP